ncbi:MAG: hypothetical protein E6G53_07425 [Actinobacteria bacterium]|nr:MAG: hypothetical protein E6G53_07425 [Actinomycetota bacterium]
MITTMYANPSASQNFSDVAGPATKPPNQSPTSSSVSITPFGVEMKRIPTTANVPASPRIVSTTARSAPLGDIRRIVPGPAPT